MALWCFQVYPDHLDIVDYYEGHGQGFDHYCAWLDERGYHGTDWYPHDVKVREAGSPGARTRIETLITMGRKPALAPNEDLMEGVNAGRKTIPFARFDAKRCAQGLESLRSYRTEWDALTARTRGATCRYPGARRCASRRRRRCLSASPSRT